MSATAPSQTVYSIGYDFHAGNGTAGSGTDNGNVFGIFNYKDTTHGRDQTFTYDALNRLISAQNAGTNCATMVLQNKTEYWGNSYAYDAWGNLLQKTITKCGAEHLSVTADAHNWIHASGTDYQYDAAGNMTYDATAALSYTFDQENRLTGAAGYTYTYDGDGNRVRKSNGNLAANGTLYWYMTSGVVAESDLAGTLKSEYVFFDRERVARKDFPGNTVAYYFSDHLKTASVITDSAGVIKAESDYYPWGGELQFINNDSNDYKFTGKKRDVETGLDYFGARYYSNGLGRWVSADWSATPVPVPYADFGDPQSLNQYAYVRNVPTTNVDPDGHDCPVCDLDQEVKELVQSLLHLTPAAAPAVVSAAPAAVLALPSAGAMTLVAALPPVQNHPADDPPSAGNMMLDALSPSYQPAPPVQGQTQNQGQTQETEHTPEPAPASSAPPMKGNGRGGKQDRLKELGKDDKVSSADRGEIKRDQNQIARGTRSTIRVLGNKNLAHRRGKEARKGYDYKHADLQNKDLHRLQHKHEGYK